MSFWICALGSPASDGGVMGVGVGDWADVEGVRMRINKSTRNAARNLRQPERVLGAGCEVFGEETGPIRLV